MPKLDAVFFLKFIFGCTGSSLLDTGFSPVSVSGATLQLRCSGFALQRLLLLWSVGSRAVGLQELWLPASRAQSSVLVAHGLSCPEVWGLPGPPVFPPLAGGFLTTGLQGSPGIPPHLGGRVVRVLGVSRIKQMSFIHSFIHSFT